MATTTIRYSGVPGNGHHAADFDRDAAAYAYPEQGIHNPSAPEETPGARRYDPDSYDPSIPDSDPRSPRYEPPHLRHRPGDTWEIGGKPHDPADPGAFGTPGWRPDPRTGRHRRGELPDPPPPVADSGQDRPPVDPAPEAADERRPSPSPRPPARQRFWEDSTEPLRFVGDNKPRHPDQPGNNRPARLGRLGDDEPPHRFNKLREDAWDRYLIDSQPLYEAHSIKPVAAMERCVRPWLAVWAFVLRVIGAAKHGAHGARPSERHQRSEQSGERNTERHGGLRRWRTPPFPYRTDADTSPHMAQWERAFDTTRGLGGAVAS
ncbi:hypothetical protein [Glycomyces buryatensis]|uniref:Uncharacterized protein n=1 Tax=Glycomyces buryatensis TaxID=2570927 RepID=A0A4S8QCV6_9ACTN|nr:hypothetical protein [Glycomyces buryatensis]THV41411.1 hypothetical protein FAB82_11465 [Glycomyces buryatensis]